MVVVVARAGVIAVSHVVGTYKVRHMTMTLTNSVLLFTLLLNKIEACTTNCANSSSSDVFP